ncbi:MAG: sigma-70 family RNA polymerase sigma factor [Deltaproteobacteria bacterium]|nr:sigma-70 family RNA polymerase sigma factor [Deltaproteobacteria bacterium]
MRAERRTQKSLEPPAQPSSEPDESEEPPESVEELVADVDELDEGEPAPAELEEKSGPLDPEIIPAEDEDEESEGVAAVDAPSLRFETASSSSGPVLDVGRTAPTVPVLSRARSGALERFLASVGKYPVLSPDEERDLTLRVYERKDPVAARKLVVHNLRLVVKMAYRYRRTWASVLDLVQEGNVGLMEAVSRFDPWKGARFSTYASYWIRAYMIRYLLEYSRMVRISRTRAGRKMFFRLSKEREKLRAQGIEPGPKLLAAKLGVSEQDFDEVARHMDQSELRLDAPLTADGQATHLDTMSSQTPSPEAAAHAKALGQEVSAALEAFGRRLTDEREIVCWNEHLMAEEPASLSDLGARFGVTKQRMGQIVNGIRKRLKSHLEAAFGPDVHLDYIDQEL